jgi:hypothetical protein
MEEARTGKRWQISICPGGTVHIHYGTGSLHILAEDFLRLMADLKKAAEEFGVSHPKEIDFKFKRMQ